MMSNIVLEFQNNHYRLDQSPSSFGDLLQLIKVKIGSDLPSQFLLFVTDDDGDEVSLNTQQDLQSNLHYFLQKGDKTNPDFIIHIKESEVQKSIYQRPKDQNQFNNDDMLSSEIIGQSLMEQRKKFALLKQALADKTQPLQEMPKQQFQPEESIYQKPENQLSLDYIMTYYKNLLGKFEANYNVQTTQQKLEQEEVYRKSFKNMVSRMQEKLVGQFEDTLKLTQTKVKEQQKGEQIINQMKEAEEAAILNEQKKAHQALTDSPAMKVSRQIAEILQIQPESILKFVEKNMNKDLQTLISMLMDGHK